MPTVTVSRPCDAPAHVLWSVVTTIVPEQTTLPHVRFERVREPDDGSRFGIGMIWTETRPDGHVDVCEVIAHDPTHHTYTVAFPDHADRVWTTLTVRDERHRSTLVMELGAAGRTPVRRLLVRLGWMTSVAATRAAAGDELDRIVATAESRV